MGILDVVHRVIGRLRARQVDIEGQLTVGFTHGQEVTGSIAADFVDQVAQGQIGAGPLGDFYLFATTHHGHHLVQHEVWPALGNTGVQCLQTGTDTGNGAVVVGALLVHHAGETTVPFVQVVGHVRYEIGVAAIGFAHHAVFVVTEIGGAQPQRATLFIGVTVGDQALDSVFHFAIAVQR